MFQGALTEDEKVTSLGHMLNQLPLELSLGKMLVQGTIFRQRSAVLTLAAALSVQSPIIQRTIRYKECEVTQFVCDLHKKDTS